MYEKTIAARTVYKGKILDLEVLDVELENGRRAVREIVRHGPAVALVVRCPDGRFLFVRQFRKAVERICFEVVAGNCDAGEDPAEAARRELTEETGYVAEHLEHLGGIYPSVGYCTERIEVFYARVGERGEASPDEDERIETVLLDEAEVEEKMRRGEVEDSKTLAAWLLYRLRVKAGE